MGAFVVGTSTVGGPDLLGGQLGPIDAPYINPAIAPGFYRPGALMRPHALRFPPPPVSVPAESWGPVPA